jgi:hypothetical protein
MQPLHTHRGDEQLHWEFNRGPVRRGELKLARFFELWGQPFSATALLDASTAETGTITMMVNGQPNAEFEQYIIHDKDVIEIRYEQGQ